MSPGYYTEIYKGLRSDHLGFRVARCPCHLIECIKIVKDIIGHPKSTGKKSHREKCWQHPRKYCPKERGALAKT